MTDVHRMEARRAQARRLGRVATRSYVMALTLLAALSAVSFVLSRTAIEEERSAAAAAELAADQVSRAQTLSLLAVRYGDQLEEAEYLALRAQIRSLRDDFLRGHRQLIAGDATTGVPPLENPAVAALFFNASRSLDFDIRRYLTLVDILLHAPERSVSEDVVYQIVELTQNGLPNALREVEAALRIEAKVALRSLARISLILFLLTLAVLVIVGAFVFRPIVARTVAGALKLFDTEDALEHSTLHDALTGLFNRAGTVRAAIRRGFVRGETTIAALHLDLEDFSNINDTLGNDAGDEVLKVCAERLLSTTRPDDVIGRIGADDYSIILFNMGSPENAMEACARIRNALAAPMTIGGRTLKLGTTAGLAIGQTDETDIEDLMANAALALSDSRALGGGDIRVFSPEMRAELKARDALLRELNAAVEGGELLAYFQPQIDLKTGRVAGFEALVRWSHPTRGILAPGHFLAAAERAGLGIAIGETVLAQSLEALSRWDAAGFHVPAVGVNFSSGELSDPCLVDRIKLAADRFDIAPQRVSIEILETVMVEDDENAVVRNIHRLKAAGFTLELDDFGTGHASLSNIRRFRVDRVKIDRSFVSHIDTDANLQKMTMAMVRMAAGLGIECLAEGVETAEEHTLLAAMGCTHLQGYSIGKPMAFEATIGWLTEHDLRLRSQSRAATA